MSQKPFLYTPQPGPRTSLIKKVDLANWLNAQWIMADTIEKQDALIWLGGMCGIDYKETVTMIEGNNGR